MKWIASRLTIPALFAVMVWIAFGVPDAIRPFVGAVSLQIATWAVLSGADNLALTIFAAGMFIGAVLTPFAVRCLTWPGEWRQYRARLDAAVHAHNTTFYGCLNRAYYKWRKENADAPDTLNQLVDGSAKPKRPDIASLRVTRIEPALQESNQLLWRFCSELSGEVHSANMRDRYKPTLLTKKQCAEFAHARRSLTSFWDREGETILSGWGLILSIYWVYRLKQYLPPRQLRLLLFLEPATGKVVGNAESHARYLFRMCLRTF